jgi:hypothetical protein
MKVRRSVTVAAVDPGEGMTIAEIMEACAGAPGDMAPRIVLGFKGQIKAIRFEVKVDTDTPARVPDDK